MVYSITVIFFLSGPALKFMSGLVHVGHEPPLFRECDYQIMNLKGMVSLFKRLACSGIFYLHNTAAQFIYFCPFYWHWNEFMTWVTIDTKSISLCDCIYNLPRIASKPILREDKNYSLIQFLRCILFCGGITILNNSYNIFNLPSHRDNKQIISLIRNHHNTRLISRLPL